MMSDEVHFHVNGSVNKQNMRFWAPAIPVNSISDHFMIQGWEFGAL